MKNYAKYYYQSLQKVLRLIILSLKLQPQDFTWAIHQYISPLHIDFVKRSSEIYGGWVHVNMLSLKMKTERLKEQIYST